MIAIALAAASLLFQSATPPAGAVWTWALYEGTGPVVLANEVTDTAYLKTTLECEPGTGIARVSLYEVGSGGGFVTLSSGDNSATVETGPSRRGAIQLSLRTDHPIFAAFRASGALDIAIGDRRTRIEVQRTHLAKLARFAEVCRG